MRLMVSQRAAATLYRALPLGKEIIVPVGTIEQLGEGSPIERALADWACKVHHLIRSNGDIPVSVARPIDGIWQVLFLKLAPIETS